MTVTPERKAELIAELEEIIGHRMDRPKVVASETNVGLAFSLSAKASVGLRFPSP
jgi:hypothetical protein